VARVLGTTRGLLSGDQFLESWLAGEDSWHRTGRRREAVSDHWSALCCSRMQLGGCAATTAA